MANPFTTGPFNCCTCPEPPDYDPNVDDPLGRYISVCGCPSVGLITSSEKRDLSLCGHNEYGSTPSSPPKKYLTETKTFQSGVSNGIQTIYACRTPFVKVDDQCYRIGEDGECFYYNEDFTDCNFTQSSFCDGDDYVTTCITGPKYSSEVTAVSVISGYQNTNYVDTTTYDPSTCEISVVRTGAGTVSYPAQGDRYALCPPPNSSSSLGQGSTFTTQDVTPEFTNTNVAKQEGSITETLYGPPITQTYTTSYQGVYFGSGCISRTTITGAGNQSYTSGTLYTYQLSDEDTEQNALARSEVVTGTDSHSSIGVRGASYNSSPFSWTIQTAKYALLFKNLRVGETYESGGLPLGSAEIGEPYEEETNIPIAGFTATDTFHIMHGTLNVTPEEFKEKNFSLNPSDYDTLSSGDEVITPTEPVIEQSGYTYKVQIESFGSQPSLHIKPSQPCSN